jgi:hypothetical protein
MPLMSCCQPSSDAIIATATANGAAPTTSSFHGRMSVALTGVVEPSVPPPVAPDTAPPRSTRPLFVLDASFRI